MTEEVKEYNLYKEEEEKLVDMLYQTTLKEYPGIPIPDEELAKELLRMGIQANRGVIEGTILKDYLERYSEKNIQKIREEKTQLMTVEEFKLVCNYFLDQTSELEEKLIIAVDALTHIKLNGLFKKAGPHGDYAPYDVATQTELAKKALAEIEREEK